MAFRWHPKARAYDGKGTEIQQLGAGGGVIPDRPSGRALALALAEPGRAFRIGGPGPAPEPGPEPRFETLTGGTTGTPRRLIRTQASWTASFAQNAALFALGPGARVAVLGRLIHSLSLYAALEALYLGADLHLLDSLRPKGQRAALARRDVTHLYATPAQMRLLIEAPGPALPLTHLLIGGSKLDPSLRALIQHHAPNCAIHEFYGAAETSFMTLSGPETDPASVGAPYPGVTLDLRGELGEVWVKTPYLFTGYADAPGPPNLDPDGFWPSGELGTMTNGLLYLAGRKGRMVKVADQSVHPEQVEALLLAQPGITRAAVLPQPDSLRGHHLVACLQGRADPDALLAAIRAAIGPLATPKSLIWIENWPALPSGKTDLAALAKALP